MKRLFSLLFVLVFLSTVTSCAVPIHLSGESAKERIIEISENPEEHLGKTFCVTGRYAYEEFAGERYHYVMVTNPEEENVGFEIRWDKDYPESGTKITVTGKLQAALEYGNYCIYLQVTKMEQN